MSDEPETKTEDEATKKPRQILKSREDQEPLILVRPDDAEEGKMVFSIENSEGCSWYEGDGSITPEKLRKRIEPWLTALCQSEHLSLLAGSGLTHAVHYMAPGSALPGMDKADFEDFKFAKAIDLDAKHTASDAGRGEGNIEDQLRSAISLLRGLEIMARTKDSAVPIATDLRAHLARIVNYFAQAILAGEAGIASAPAGKRDTAFRYLVTFLMAFASRSGTRDRLHIFTTNYDRLIEAGADIAGLRLLDRFVGALAPVFRSSRLDLDIHYNPPGIRGEPRYLEGVARFTKLHGSVDWVDTEGNIRRIGLPFGAKEIAPHLAAPGLAGADELRLMIYPNAGKDRETAGFPYVELFRDFAASCCRPNHVLFTYGYSFGDEHINRVIEDMLTIPSTHLVIMAFSDPMDRIMKTYDRVGRPAQISLLIGDHLGDLATLVDRYLPKPAIDRTTFRMAELLKARMGTTPMEPKPAKGAGDSEDGSTS